MKLNYFKDIAFLPAIKALFKELKVPMNYVADEPTTAKEILKDTHKDNSTFQLVDDVYFVGMVDDAAFEGNKSLDVKQIKSDYDGILIFGITLHQRPNNLLPTRSQLAEISRAFNREFYYTPVVLVFKYKDNQADYIAFANTERLQYKQAWREGEKAGKVSLLRDINIEKPHRGHEDIVDQLRIPTTGTKAVDSFAKLYTYWQEVFSVSVLNKKFYQELSNWYFWAVKHVTFPNKPTPEIAHQKNVKLEDLIQEHNATNVIRLLTRLLFTWFIKEKKLIPEALFDLDALQKDILNDISPYHEEGTMFAQANKESIYYKAILQNLFFASLNCPIEADGIDNRTRGFRGDGYGTHRGIDYLMRYKTNFKNPDAFLKMMNQTVPFLNGGLFECLDDKYQNIYIDGFSDQMTKGEQLVVPDYLFFGVEEEVDLSTEYGVKNKGTKQAAVKGLINILKSYKFTITENTPIEEDVALDPELLGKVFENLLASYNPETKTTARKQTGSFYTPREIVNYMVDESLIAYLKNAVTDWNIEEATLDEKLHELTSFDPSNPFEDSKDLTKRIVKALDECKILDPACGSGAFPMGILQKMVHMLQKLDPENEFWKAVQIEKTEKELKDTLSIEDKKEREEKLKEINEAFDQSMNDPDYARKLYLIENCIYGVDIQPIASQISKLRFFISLVVDQKPSDNATQNFGIRPLPNLETKFVTANTLIGIEKPKAQTSLFDTKEIKLLEAELKKVRHKLFSARTKDTKLKYRQKDEELRNKIAEELKRSGWHNDSAEKLAGWDPYDQNASSPFFDTEWMFDISGGFDIVIGNPPYHQLSKDKSVLKSYKDYLKNKYETSGGRLNLFIFFTHEAINLAKQKNGIISYIIPNTILTQEYYSDTRKKILNETSLLKLVDYDEMPFENAVVENVTFVLKNTRKEGDVIEVFQDNLIEMVELSKIDQNQFLKQKNYTFNINSNDLVDKIISNTHHRKVSTLCEVNQGIALKGDKSLSLKSSNPDKEYYQLLDGRNINKYKIDWDGVYLDYDLERIHSCKRKDIFETSEKLFFRRVSKNLIFTYDNSQFFALNTLIVVNKKPNCKDDLKALLAIFNSDILNYVYQKQYKSTKKVFSEIQARSVKELPIPIMKASVGRILAVLSDIQISNNGIDKIFSTISNSIVNELYFPEHMIEKEIDVLEFVERDMKKALQGREFDSLSDAEKEKVIEQLHATWSHPDNEVRNRIKLFAVRSPEILKPILES